ncbi:GIY-YIG nuclease family protein [Limnobaculum parvum]|uniref:GIY-YIG nuclease family protein n=1 Tax=Limnobaculum parvum TaxID=2172103 RepID=UPI001E3501D7|nr:GIY-YIG nuclease family protein [Limnobaculum parvum]
MKQSGSLAEKNDWYLYILRTADNRLYTGITTSIERRFKQHQSGNGAKALRNAGELTLVYQIKTAGHSEALKLEYRVKQLTKAKKEKLVNDQPSIEQLTALLNH